MRVIAGVLALVIGCAPASPFRGGRGGGGASPSGTVYRTTSGGSHVASSKEAPRGGSGSNGLLKAGLITLGAGYVGTVVGGNVIEQALFEEQDYAFGAGQVVDKLWLPVIGAWSGLVTNATTVLDNCEAWAAEQFGRNCDQVRVASVGLYVGAMAQTTGLVLTVIGLMRNRGGDKDVGSSRALSLQPITSPTGGGFAVSGRW